MHVNGYNINSQFDFVKQKIEVNMLKIEGEKEGFFLSKKKNVIFKRRF